MLTTAVLVALLVSLAVALVLGLRVAYLLQEVFQRLARLEKNAEGRGKDKDETVPSGASGADSDKKRDLDQDLVNDIFRVAQREVRRHARFSALARLRHNGLSRTRIAGATMLLPSTDGGAAWTCAAAGTRSRPPAPSGES